LNYNFSEDTKTADGQEKEITYGEYVEKINQRALQRQLKKIEERRKGDKYSMRGRMKEEP
jgi:hypothetical protein